MIAIPESYRDLLTIPVAILVTNGPDGYPQTTALWFLYDEDGGLRISLNTARQKVKNLRADPHCTLFFIDPANPYRTLEVRAQATLEDDPDYAFATRVGAKYGADMRQNDAPGDRRVVVTLQPVKVNTWPPGG
ncbi:MAG TPA: PPOX class F420-dependent oxidoreductase [Chloroflexia bacterium]|nr:PPOX class F420-dependent oxidoreductase [Chloroflexia bacterium]